MLRVIPNRQEILITNNNTPGPANLPANNYPYPHPAYMGPLGTENNGASVLAVPYPRVRV